MDDEILNNVDNTPSDDSENKSAISADLIRGHINTIILRTLYERDKYGYEIIEEIETRSHGQYTLKQPTLYSALKRLESQGYINAYWKTDEVSQGGRRKYYTLTDGGREIAEKNQAEWEYSRTVIDSLISDKNFDFSQPAPTAVDFKILKNSTTRVHSTRSGEDDDDEDEQPSAYTQPVQNVQPVHTVQQPAQEPAPVIEQPVQFVQPQPQQVEYAEQQTQTTPPVRELSEEERKQLHENYLKLIFEPVAQPAEPSVAPNADDIDTEKLIYNNRPETERDYRHLINHLFVKTLQPQADNPPPAPVQQQTKTERVNTVNFEDIAAKSENDGLTVNTSDYKENGSRRKRYNLAANLFKSALIVAVVMLFEFALCLIFRKELGIALAYPFVILAIAAAQTLIFGVIHATNVIKTTAKPASLTYLTAAIVVAVIIILIICVIAILLNVNFSSTADILAKIIVPSLVTLNIPLFATLFCIFSK